MWAVKYVGQMCKCYPTKGKTVLPGRQLPIVKLLWHWNVGNILRAFICIMSLRGSLQLRRDYGGVSGEHRKWEPDQQTDFMQFCLCVPIYELYDPPLERRTPWLSSFLPSFPYHLYILMILLTTMVVHFAKTLEICFNYILLSMSSQGRQHSRLRSQ